MTSAWDSSPSDSEILADEFLHGLLQNTRNRQALRTLEDTLDAFVCNHNVKQLQVPPKNPFYRKIVFVVARRYNLTHHIVDPSTVPNRAQSQLDSQPKQSDKPVNPPKSDLRALLLTKTDQTRIPPSRISEMDPASFKRKPSTSVFPNKVNLTTSVPDDNCVPKSNLDASPRQALKSVSDSPSLSLSPKSQPNEQQNYVDSHVHDSMFSPAMFSTYSYPSYTTAPPSETVTFSANTLTVEPKALVMRKPGSLNSISTKNKPIKRINPESRIKGATEEEYEKARARIFNPQQQQRNQQQDQEQNLSPRRDQNIDPEKSSTYDNAKNMDEVPTNEKDKYNRISVHETTAKNGDYYEKLYDIGPNGNIEQDELASSKQKTRDTISISATKANSVDRKADFVCTVGVDFITTTSVAKGNVTEEKQTLQKQDCVNFSASQSSDFNRSKSLPKPSAPPKRPAPRAPVPGSIGFDTRGSRISSQNSATNPYQNHVSGTNEGESTYENIDALGALQVADEFDPDFDRSYHRWITPPPIPSVTQSQSQSQSQQNLRQKQHQQQRINNHHLPSHYSSLSSPIFPGHINSSHMIGAPSNAGNGYYSPAMSNGLNYQLPIRLGSPMVVLPSTNTPQPSPVIPQSPHLSPHIPSLHTSRNNIRSYESSTSTQSRTGPLSSGFSSYTSAHHQSHQQHHIIHRNNGTSGVNYNSVNTPNDSYYQRPLDSGFSSNFHLRRGSQDVVVTAAPSANDFDEFPPLSYESKK